MRPRDTSLDPPPLRVHGLAELIERPVAEQRQSGYAHTASEIAQQPATWLATARRVIADLPAIAGWLAEAGITPDGRGSLVLTGSGSSLFVGECLTAPLQAALQAPVTAVSSGALLTQLEGWLPAARPGLLVSFARSGDSPESAAAVDEALAARPHWHHLIITCNRSGRLATYQGRDRVRVLVLDDRTCDRSLVMTSSFTNMAIAGAALGWLGRADAYGSRVTHLAEAAARLIEQSGRIATIAQRPFSSALFLGSDARHGAAREAALKLLEMSDGGVHTMAETYLGLRHGPMSAIGKDTLVVCFLSSDPVPRAYEVELVRELAQKQLGTRLLIGDDVPGDLLRDQDSRLECPGLSATGDDLGAMVHVVAGQLLALFRCLSLGLKPDAPSHDNTINRVVTAFAIHRRAGAPATDR